jgi:hypothetical protein
MLGYNFTLLHCSCRNMRDVDTINFQYDNTLIRAYMLKGATLHNASMLSQPESYAFPSLRYLTKKLSAEPPPSIAVSPPPAGLHATACLTISTPQTQLVPLGVDKSYKPAVHCEAALNQLVQFSIQQQSIAWVSLNVGFPTMPLRLSEVCRGMQRLPSPPRKRISSSGSETSFDMFCRHECSTAQRDRIRLLGIRHVPLRVPRYGCYWPSSTTARASGMFAHHAPNHHSPTDAAVRGWHIDHPSSAGAHK